MSSLYDAPCFSIRMSDTHHTPKIRVQDVLKTTPRYHLSTMQMIWIKGAETAMSLAGTELFFFTAAPMMLCFTPVTKTVLGT